MNSSEIINLQNICRFCVKRSNAVMRPIIESVKLEPDALKPEVENILQMILNCTGLQISSTDNLPRLICNECFLRLQASNDFRNQCHNSAEYLNSIAIVEHESKSEQCDVEVDSKILMNTNPTTSPLLEIISKNPIKVMVKRKCKIKRRKRGRPPKSVNPLLNEKENKQHAGICQICGAIRRDLRVHILSHQISREFLCDICGKVFKNKSGILKHIVSVHVNARNHKCHLCPMAFNNKYCLTKHLRIHLAERKHVCKFCKKSFLIAHGLYMHVKTHTQERLHHCEYCGKSFGTNGNLKSHIGIHTGEKPFKCGLCPMTFVNTSSAAMHRKTHFNGKSHQCALCQKEFTSVNIFRIHMKIDHQIIF